jgi:hypothetical protein
VQWVYADTPSIFAWLLRNKYPHEQKLRLPEFMARLAFLDGPRCAAEIKIVLEVARELFVSRQELQNVLKPYLGDNPVVFNCKK